MEEWKFTNMQINLVEILKEFLELIGFGVLLHYYSYAIGYGLAKGRARVKQKNEVDWKLPEIIVKHTYDKTK